MAGYNRVVLIGNLTRDPEYKQLASGQAVCRLGLATNRQFKNKQTGALVQEVCYVDVDVWGAQAESCRQYLQKGRAVLIEGRLKFDSWEDPNGQTRSKLSVVADRVVFLNFNAPEENESAKNEPMQGAKSSELPEPQNELEKELFDQIKQIKSRNTKKQVDKPDVAKAMTDREKEQSSAEPVTGEIDFKDVPPFEDELPF